MRVAGVNPVAKTGEFWKLRIKGVILFSGTG